MKNIVTKIEDTIVRLKQERIDLSEYVYVITPQEYDAICKYYGVEYNKYTIFNFMGVAMSVGELSTD